MDWPCAVRGGPLLPCCTGWALPALDWQAQIERFSEHYRVVAMDLRGHGQSMQEGPFDVPTLAADVARWLDEQPEPAWVVGLSLGAMVALELALRLPHKVQGWCWSTASANFCWRPQRSRSAMPCASSGCAGSACGRWRGGSVASSFPVPISPGAPHLPGRFVRNKRRPTRRCWRRCPAGRCGPVSAPSGSRWPSSPPVTTICPGAAGGAVRLLPNATIHTPDGHHAWPAEDPAGFNHLLHPDFRNPLNLSPLGLSPCMDWSDRLPLAEGKAIGPILPIQQVFPHVWK